MGIIMMIIGLIFLFGIAPAIGLYSYIFSSFYNFIKFFFLFLIGVSLISFVIKLIITAVSGAVLLFNSTNDQKVTHNNELSAIAEQRKAKKKERNGNIVVNFAVFSGIMGFIPNIGILFGLLAIILGLYSAIAGTDYKLNVFMSFFFGIVSIGVFVASNF